MPKQKYYSLEDIWKTGADYLLLNGERSNGKSYSAKAAALKMAWTECDPFTGEKVRRYQFAYLRRREKEANGTDALGWLADMVEDSQGGRYIETLTNGEADHICYFRKKLFFAKHDAEGKSIKIKECGHVFALSIENQYKSLAFPLVGLMIFEEYITVDGYLNREIMKLQSLTSTIFRRDAGRVILVGNTMSRACPYFQEWGLVNAIKQQPGTIDIYEHGTDQIDEETGETVVVRIAVEFCENSGNNSKMFFGQGSKMVTSGEWYSEEQPKLSKSFDEYEEMWPIGFYYSGIGFYGRVLYDPEKQYFLLYVEPWQPEAFPEDLRILSDAHALEMNVTQTWDAHFRHDAEVRRLIEQNKLAFSDNLTGTEFRQMLIDNVL